MEVSFEDWTNRLKVRNEYLTALGEYKVRQAEAELKKAETAGLKQMVRAKELLIRQLEKDLQALARSKQTTNVAIQRAKANSKNALRLLKGTKLSASEFSTARAAYEAIIVEAIIEAGDALFSIPVSEKARAASNFHSVRDSRQPTTAPAEVDNAIELLGWMLERSQELVAKSGSDAQRAVVQVFKAINDAAAKYVAAADAALDKIENGTYDAWSVDALLASSLKGPGANIAVAGAR